MVSMTTGTVNAFALNNLQELDLRGTKTSEGAVAALQKALPKCKILSGAVGGPGGP